MVQAEAPYAARPDKWLGAAALVFGALQLANHLRRGEYWENLWACNVSPFIISAGILAELPLVLGCGVCWLSMGTVLWLIDLASGGELLIPSIFSHVGALAAGAVAARWVGWPRNAWLVGTLAMMTIIGLSRLFAPPATNLNLAFAVWKGWESWFPRPHLYLAFILVVNSAGFAVADQVMRRLVPAFSPRNERSFRRQADPGEAE